MKAAVHFVENGQSKKKIGEKIRGISFKRTTIKAYYKNTVAFAK